MVVKVFHENKDLPVTQIREIMWEFLQWANAKANQEFGVNFEIESMLEEDMQHFDKFMPPNGRVLLAYADECLAGIACLMQLAPGIGQIKRVYIRPGYRKRGLGRALISQLLVEAAQIGYERICLDSAGFMKAAHHLYRAVGFSEIEAYEGSEIPEEFQKHWIFMELDLRRENNRER